MANVEKLSIALSSDMVRSIKDAVDSGDYATTSEVIRDAVRLWRFKRTTVDPADTKAIRKLVAEGIASADSGRMKPAAEVFDRLIAKYSAMAKAKKCKTSSRR
jgi:antitoxin ParD1/3/4